MTLFASDNFSKNFFCIKKLHKSFLGFYPQKFAKKFDRNKGKPGGRQRRMTVTTKKTKVEVTVSFFY